MKGYFTLLRNNITRFLPLWGGYILYLLWVVLKDASRYLSMPWNDDPNLIVRFAVDLKTPVVIYGCLCAVLLWGDLLSNRRSGMVFSFPVRREGQFLVHFLSGSLFYLIPTFLFYLSSPLWIKSPVFWWEFLYISCLFLLCFGLGSLSVMLSGQGTGAVLLLSALLVSPLVCRFLYNQMYAEYLPSLPVPYADDVDFDLLLLWRLEIGRWEPVTMGILGAVSSVAALVLFRIRKAEATGQFTTVSFLRYVFCAAAALIAATLLFGLLKQKADKDFWLLFIYIPVFYFAFAMVAERRFLVFGKWHLLTLGILTAVFFNSIWMVRYDALGLLSYVPDPDRVKNVEVYIQQNSIVGGTIQYFPYEPECFRKDGMKVNARKDIQLVTETHQLLLEDAETSAIDGMAYLTYTLKSGIKVRRYYPVKPADTAWENLNNAVSTKESLFGLEDFEDYKEGVYYIEVRRARGGDRTFCFCDDNYEAAGGVVKITGKKLRMHFIELLRKDADEKYLQQLDYDNYIVTVKYRDGRSRCCSTVLRIPHGSSVASGFLDICWDTARALPEKVITDDTALQCYDLAMSADGSFTKIPRPYVVK